MTADIHLSPDMGRARRLLLDVAICPACGSALSTSRCGVCRLDLSGTAGDQLWQASRDAVAALEARAILAARLRDAQLAAVPVSVAAPAAAFTPAPVGFVPAPFAAPRAGPPPLPYRPPAPAGPPSAPWRVQTVLQVLGVALLAMASLVFLAFSWNVLSLGARGAVVGAITVAVLVLASWLNRRGLEGSAQAVGVLGALLVILDAWAVYAIGLTGSADPAGYAAVACVVCAVVLGLYGEQTGIRAGTVTACLLLPLAPVMVLGNAGSVAGAALLLLAVVALATVRFVRTPMLAGAERAVLATAAILGAVLAPLVALFAVADADEPAQRWPGIGVLALVAAVLVVQGALAAAAARGAGRRAGAARAWAAGAGTVGAATATAAAVTLGLPSASGAALLGVALAVLVFRWPAARAGRGIVTVTADAAALTALAVATPTVVSLVADGFDATVRPGTVAWADAATTLASTASVVVLLAVLSLGARTGVTRPARHAAVVLGLVLVLVAAVVVGPLLTAHTVPAAVGASAALLVASAAAAVVAGRRTDGTRWYLRAAAVLGVAAAVVASLDAPWWTGVALAAGAVLAFSARRWRPAAPVAAASSAAGVLLAWAALAQFVVDAGVLPGPAVAGAATVAVLALVAGALFLAPSRTERHTLLATGLALGAGCWTGGALGATDAAGAAVPTIVLGGVLAVAALAVAVLGQQRVATEVVQLSAVLVAPLGALTLTTAHLLTARPDAVGLALLLVVLGGVAAVAAGHSGWSTVDLRPALEGSGWAVVLTGLLVAASQGGGVEALALLLAALAAAVGALREDRRPQWWVALGLLVVASWVTLGVRGVGAPEAYLAPLGAVLALVGALRWRRGGAHAAELLGAGLALALVPTAVIDDPLTLGSTALDRTVLATVSAGLLVVAGLLVLRRRGPSAVAGTDPLLAIAAVAAALAALGPGRRAIVLAGQSWTAADVPPVELWALPAAVLLAGAAAVWLGDRTGPDPVRRPAPWVVLLLATVPVVLTRDDGPAGLARIAVVAALGTLLAARGAAGRMALPGGRGASWAPVPPDLIGQGAALLTAATVAGLCRTWPVPDDAVVAGLGVLLLVVGGVRMRVFPHTPTWTALGPGLVAALAAPTLVALVTGTGWRVGVAIVGGLLAVGVGAARRWQAPFVVGAAVLVVELLVQLAPVTRQAIGGLGWWPVLAVGGAALLGLGLTYERRLRDAREAVRYVAQMT